MKSLAEFLEVEERQRFLLGHSNIEHCVLGNRLKKHVGETWRNAVISLNDLIELLEDNITLVPTYSPETIEAAKHDSYRFKYVARDGNGDLNLFYKKPVTNKDEKDCFWGVFGTGSLTVDDYICRIRTSDYPEVKPGECVALSEIVGGEK